MARRYARKRDQNEPPIVEALRRAGALVWRLGATGVPDLLVGKGGRWVLLEVKMPGKSLNSNQEPFFADCAGERLPVRIVRTPEEALEALEA